MKSATQDNIFFTLLFVVMMTVCICLYFFQTKPFIERCEALGGEMVYTATSKTKVCEIEIGNLFKAER